MCSKQIRFHACAYFFYRYFLKLGFLDGLPGWMWHFWQGLWYRCLVDYEIGKPGKRPVFPVWNKRPRLYIHA